MSTSAVVFEHSPPSAPLGVDDDASTSTTVLEVGSFPPRCENFHGETCFYEQGERTYDECADICQETRGAMVCPTSQFALEHIVLRHRDESFASASVGEPLQQLWARNKCPASSALGGRRWRAADYERTLQYLPVLLEERNISSAARARCLCEFPASSCDWESNQTANLCPRELGSSFLAPASAKSSTEVATPCDCSTLRQTHGPINTTILIAPSMHKELSSGEWLALLASAALLVFVLVTAARQLTKRRRRESRRALTFQHGSSEGMAGRCRVTDSGAGALGGDPSSCTTRCTSSISRSSCGGGGGSSGVGAFVELPSLSLEEFRLELFREWERGGGSEDTYDPVEQAGRGLTSARLSSPPGSSRSSARPRTPRGGAPGSSAALLPNGGVLPPGAAGRHPPWLARLSTAQVCQYAGGDDGPSTERSDRTTARSEGPGRQRERTSGGGALNSPGAGTSAAGAAAAGAASSSSSPPPTCRSPPGTGRSPPGTGRSPPGTGRSPSSGSPPPTGSPAASARRERAGVGDVGDGTCFLSSRSSHQTPSSSRVLPALTSSRSTRDLSPRQSRLPAAWPPAAGGPVA